MCVSKDEVELMIAKALDTYDKTIGSKRHEENISKFNELFGALNKLLGGVGTLKFIGSLIGLACTVIAVVIAIRK